MSTDNAPRKRHFSMIRDFHLADFLTLSNGACGTAAIFFSMGRELDSLADVIAFGVAPACLGFAVGLTGLLDCLVLLYFVGCGISRLARYNITAEKMSEEAGKVTYFEGTPIPTSVFLVLAIMALAWRGAVDKAVPGGTVSLAGWDLHPLTLLYALSGSLMISKTI